MVVSSALAFILLITILCGLSWQAEKDARAAAEAEVRRWKKTLTQFAEARSLLRRGRPRDEVIKKVKAALNGGTRISLDEQLFTNTPALTQLLSLSKQSQEQNEYTHFANAQELIQARKFREAIEQLNQIEDDTSALDGAKLEKGICALELKNYQLATTSFTDVVKRNTRSKEAHLLRSVAY